MAIQREEESYRKVHHVQEPIQNKAETPPEEIITLQRETIYEQMQRVQEGSDSESEKITRLVSIIRDLLSPYNVLVSNSERLSDSTFETDSNDYKWGSCSNITKDVEEGTTIHSYTTISQEGQGAESRLLEFGP